MNKPTDLAYESKWRHATLLWCGAALLQISRLEQSLLQSLSITTRMTEPIIQAHNENRKPDAQNTPIDPGLWDQIRKIDKLQFADKYFLLLSLNQVIKSTERLAPGTTPKFEHAELFKLLRSFEEHWEDPSGRSGTELRQDRPDITNWVFTTNGFTILIEDVPHTDIADWLHNVINSLS